MTETNPLDVFPLWCLFLLTVAVVALSVEVGFRIGRYRGRQAEMEKDSPVSTIVGATLGLLAFVLAFTFGLAASRFDAHRQIIVKESNAIGTAFLRADMLPEPHDAAVRKLLRDYVDLRLQPVQRSDLDAVLAKSEELHHALWTHATEAARQDPHSIVTGLFIQSLNDVIDVHSERVLIAVRSRIPSPVWLGLDFITVLAMGALGYHEGIAGSRRSIAGFALVLAFSAIALLIADLDRPQEGMLKVSQQAMLDLRSFMDNSHASGDGAKP